MEKMCEHDWKIVSLSEQNQEKSTVSPAQCKERDGFTPDIPKSTNIANDTAGANSLPVDGLCGTL